MEYWELWNEIFEEFRVTGSGGVTIMVCQHYACGTREYLAEPTLAELVAVARAHRHYE